MWFSCFPMEMEVPEVFNDHGGLIARGQRTKRMRPSSPSDLVMSSSSSGGRGDGHSDLCFSVLSPAMSSEISAGGTTSEEDEDMVNCLMLLAKGEHVEAEVGSETKKAAKRGRFSEMAVTRTSKTGLYVYECKTCNRSFPSFQALGGHRASHKKPKTVTEEKATMPPPPPPPPAQIKEEERMEEEQAESNHKIVTPPLPLPPPHIANNKGIQSANNGSNSSKPKIHECSICGSEFSSGQALGGHMRRHRSAPPPSKRIITPGIESNIEGPRNFLALDLNLPAPEEESSKFQFSTNSHQQHLVFSAPALVDCHY